MNRHINKTVSLKDIDNFVVKEQNILKQILLSTNRKDIWFSDIEIAIHRTVMWLNDEKLDY